jgi:hypothetical protein
MQRRKVLLSGGLALSGLANSESARAADAGQGWLVGSLGAKWARAALVLGVEYAPLLEPRRTKSLTWSNQGMFGIRGGIEMPAQEMPAIEGLRLAVVHEALAPGRYVMHRLITRPWKFADEEKDEHHQIFFGFDIEPGRATYMGELVAWMTAGTKLPFGLVAPHGLQLSLRDERERDFRVLRAAGVPINVDSPLKAEWLDSGLPERFRRRDADPRDVEPTKAP